MENCEIHYGEISRTLATKTVTKSALVALFDIPRTATCWLRGLSGTHVFADENGAFPQLDSFGTYEVEISENRNAKRAHELSEEDSSDAEFAQNAYRLATSNKNAKKGKRHVPVKGKGPKGGRASFSPANTPESDHTSSWYFKVTVGERCDSRIRPIRNCLVKCTSRTSCSDIKEALSHELSTPAENIALYDSDTLEISASPGRVGKNLVLYYFKCSL